MENKKWGLDHDTWTLTDSSTINIIKGVFKYIKELEAVEKRDKDRLEI